MEKEGRLTDLDASHYEGDHLDFEPKKVSPDDVFTAFDRINRHFYSWKNILRRWWRFISVQSPAGGPMRRLLYPILISAIFFKLSLFQRDHAKQKVYGQLGGTIPFSRKGTPSVIQEGAAVPFR